MSDGMLDSFWSSLQRTEQRIEAEARDIDRTLYRTLYSYESRVMRLRWAIEASGPLARTEIAGKLKGISLDAIWSILISVVKDIALYYGGSIVLGTAVGAGLGSLAFGAGAVPGAALGFEAGVVLGEWVMTFLGLKMLAEGLIDTIPQAASCYVEGFRAAWGPSPSDRPGACHTAGYAPSKETAALQFAHGHVLMIMAILIAMVAYLLRGKSKEALFKAVGDSKRLGSKVADWLKENEGKLLKEESLKPKVRPQPEPAQETPKAKPKPSSDKTRRIADPKKVSNGPAANADNSSWVRPRGWRLPATNGKWTGTPGDSGWLSTNPEVNAITGGKPIPFNKGYPDFSEWSQGSFTFDNLTGQNSDFSLVNQAVAKEYGLPNQTAGQNLLRDLELTAHHVEDGKTIQLIPTALHSNIPHIGGASFLRGGN